MKKNDFFSLPETQQRMVLEQAAIRHNLAKQSVEKDLWVTAIIQIIFTLPCADSLVFKGGTSLSKVWGLINRFSEDIDLAIDRTIFNLDGELTKKIQLVPPTESMASWKNDYEETNGSMIYNNPPSFEDLLESMDLLEQLFRQRS